MPKNHRKNSKKKGYAMITTFGIMTILSVAVATYVSSATQITRDSKKQTLDLQTTSLCEAGVQHVLRELWRPFKINQNFFDMEDVCTGASVNGPKAMKNEALEGNNRYTAGVISFTMPSGDTYTRLVTVRSVGWIDRNNNGVLDAKEPRKIVDVTASFQLARSQVFDYTYFVNNYGWMDGFGTNDLVVNGDMRANGNFNFLNGYPTVNGSVYASLNEKLSPAAAGLINDAPVKWTNSTYATNQAGSTSFKERWRQAYDPAVHGARGTDEYEKWRDFIFDSDGQITNNRTSGAVLADSTGYRSWSKTASGTTPTKTLLDSRSTDEVIMPDLSNLTYYQNLSTNYIDSKATFGDGTANPNYGQGAWVEVWDSTLNGGAGAYKRVDTNGVINGSAVLIGTDSKPIRIHGPVTVTQDAVIKGTISGQGTVYTGRNVHIVGDLKYGDKNLAGTNVGTPDFRGNNPQNIDNANEKRNFLGLAARGSVIMGNTTSFTASWPLQYMTPPFTKGRYDDSGNWIPPFNANEVDSTGKKRYQSTISDSTMNSIATNISQMDAILYTNFVGGGNIGTGGGGVTFNGSIISKDEAMVVFSLPMRMNYDNRIRERTITKAPLIDLQLPRSPTLLRSTWQDRGFSQGY